MSCCCTRKKNIVDKITENPSIVFTLMQPCNQITTGAHLCIVDRTQDTNSAVKKIERALEQYGASYLGPWKLDIEQYKIKSEYLSQVTHKELKADSIVLCASSALPQNMLIAGGYSAVIADIHIVALFKEYLRHIECTYSVVVQGYYYRVNDFMIRYGRVFKADKDLQQVVIDFEYLPSGHPQTLRLLKDIRNVIYPGGKPVTNQFLKYAGNTVPSVPSFSYADLAFTYAGILYT